MVTFGANCAARIHVHCSLQWAIRKKKEKRLLYTTLPRAKLCGSRLKTCQGTRRSPITQIPRAAYTCTKRKLIYGGNISKREKKKRVRSVTAISLVFGGRPARKRAAEPVAPNPPWSIVFFFTFTPALFLVSSSALLVVMRSTDSTTAIEYGRGSERPRSRSDL